MSESIVVAALYQFKPLTNVQDMQQSLSTLGKEVGLKGTLILAEEGINGTVAGARESIDKLKTALLTFFDALEYKESFTNSMPFHRFKVLIKKEIVTIGDASVTPYSLKGTYVNPEEWNDLISDPDVLILDARNDYEVCVGTFQGAIHPHTQTFREFPKFAKTLPKSKKIAMFCTGGIRCEKASSYMLSQGFQTVYHLKGGILKYLETIPPEQSLWEGECFVFDGRVAVSNGLKQGQYASCHGCRHPISQKDIESPTYERGVSCPHCVGTLTPQKQKSARERQHQEDLARKRGHRHIGTRSYAN